MKIRRTFLIIVVLLTVNISAFKNKFESTLRSQSKSTVLKANSTKGEGDNTQAAGSTQNGAQSGQIGQTGKDGQSGQDGAKSGQAAKDGQSGQDAAKSGQTAKDGQSGQDAAKSGQTGKDGQSGQDAAKSGQTGKDGQSGQDAAKSGQDASGSDGIKQKILAIFNSASQGSNCDKKAMSVNSNQNNNTDALEKGIPYPKQNPYKNIGFNEDDIRYFGDFLNPLMKSDFIKEAEEIFQNIQKVQEKDCGCDPYSTKKLYKKFTNKDPGSLSEDQLIEGIFEKETDPQKKQQKIAQFKVGISPCKLKEACTQFNWKCAESNEKDPAKSLVDKFDYNGDGRLSPLEFFTFLVVENNHKIMVGGCKANCFNNILKQYLLPMYQYLDCKEDNKLTAQEIWSGFKQLKRNSETYDIYKFCDAASGSYNTNVISDFVIKSNRDNALGQLNKSEFGYGLLMMFVYRQMNDEKIVSDEAISQVETRWTPDKKNTIFCKNFQKQP